MIRFTAEIPLLTTGQKRRRRISKKVWETLLNDFRDCDVYILNEIVGTWRTTYYELIPIPPYPNPAVEAIRRKLRRYKPTEIFFKKEGISFIRITTLEK